MLDQWTNLVLTGKSPDFLIVVAFVTERMSIFTGLRLINDDERSGYRVFLSSSSCVD